MPDPLSVRLREETAAAHRDAEASPFVKAFMAGSLPADAVVDLLHDLRHVYFALESGLVANAADPRIAPLVLPVLWRVPALDDDLVTHGRALDAPGPAAAGYVERLRGFAAEDPALLVAHAYTRYLGDLSGGQALGKVAEKKLGMPPVAFWRFHGIDRPGAFKDDYRRRLDELPLGAAEADRVVAEARRAFEVNRAVMDDVFGRFG